MAYDDYADIQRLTIEGAVIRPNYGSAVWRNFSGGPTNFNSTCGKRFFNIDLEQEDAEKLIADGWHVNKWTPEPNELISDPEPQYRLQVLVNFATPSNPRYKPVEVYMICNGVKTRLDEETVGILDTALIITADVAINPHYYNVNGKEGITAYLQYGYFTIANEDPFAEKYAEEEAPIEPPF